MRVVRIFFKVTHNNLFVTITNLQSETLYKASAGLFVKGSLRSDTLAAKALVKEVLFFVKLLKNPYVILFFKGYGRSKRVLFFELLSIGVLKILGIYQSFAGPHGGCRQKKIRRLLYRWYARNVYVCFYDFLKKEKAVLK